MSATTSHPPDAWHLLRSAVATAASQHWRSLRAIAPQADPRTVAAEAVATRACSLVQSPVLWEALHQLQQQADGEPPDTSPIMPHEAAQLGREMEALSCAARTWADQAYHHRPRTANDH